MMMKLKTPFHRLDIHVVFLLYVFVYVDLRAKDDQTFSHIHHMSMIYVFVDWYSPMNESFVCFAKKAKRLNINRFRFFNTYN
jgi:hypothetical protein